jgi:N-acylneuraminate cytidylyltransferase
MRILGIIPARGGSKGVPGKNIKLLGGLPLIAYTSNAANDSKYLNKTIISTDDLNIAEVAKQFQIDTASSIQVVQHVVTYLESQEEYYDAICLLQPTSPFRKKGFIDKAIEKFINEAADALVSVLPVPHEFNPHWVFESNNKGFLHLATGDTEIIKRRQDLPPAYFRDGSIYITKTTVIKNGSFYGNKLSYIENDADFYVNVDTLKDWDKAVAKLPIVKDKL